MSYNRLEMSKVGCSINSLETSSVLMPNTYLNVFYCRDTKRILEISMRVSQNLGQLRSKILKLKPLSRVVRARYLIVSRPVNKRWLSAEFH